MAENIFNECVYADEKVWISYNTEIGQSQCGDYGYLKAYAPNREEAVINGKHYVKGKINKIGCVYGHIRFFIDILAENGDTLYAVTIDDPSRLYLSL